MITPLRSVCVSRFWIFLLTLTGLAAVARAQTAATGTVEGRVFDAGRREYLEKVRLTIEGTTLETFSDAIGQYHFASVPVGLVRIKATYTGLAPQLETVAVEAGRTTEHEITLRAGPAAAADEAVKLQDFVVAAKRQMDAASIAINEQRYAPNITGVVAADEFGEVVDGTPAEVMKFLPGISIEYSAGEARMISMNGVPASNVPITIDGADLASMASAGTSRTVQLDSVSINNLSRIEVLQSPTPESQGSALAGSVNMVSRSAFERSRPEFRYSIGATLKDAERSLRKTPGPIFTPERKVTPTVNFAAIVPVNKRFGFTLSGNTNSIYQLENWSQGYWRGVTAATNGTTLPDTTPDKPYLTDYRIHDSPRMSRSSSLGTTLDYRLSSKDRLSLSLQYSFIGVERVNRRIDFYVNAVDAGNFNLSSTHGRAGAGEVRISSQSCNDWLGTTVVGSLTYRHNGPLWKAESGLGYSTSSLHLRDIDKGYFNAVTARRTGVTIDFDDINYLQPGRITVTDAATGAPVDIYNLDNYALSSATTNPRDYVDGKRSAYANLARDFRVRHVPVTLKAGLDVRQALRDNQVQGSDTYNFVGADRRASTNPTGSDDAAGLVLDESFSQRVAPYGFGHVPWLHNGKFLQLYQSHPDYFTQPDANSRYRSIVGSSKFAQETVSSAFVRADVSFFDRRLRFTGGVRGEQTNVEAEGPLTDPTLNFQRDASGAIIDADPARAGIQPQLIVPASNALGVSQLTYLPRAQHAKKEYLRLFPSLNVSYNLREYLIARAAYYTSVGRPDFNQYAGGITLPDTSVQPNSSNAARIRVNNAAIKAWSAESFKVRLEYYHEHGGQLSLGAFRREFTNLFGNTTFPASPEFLQLYDLDPSLYGEYEVVTQHNLTERVRMTGLEFAYKQTLTFLPHWARGVTAFANASAQRATGDSTNALNGYVPRTYNWGVALNRPKYSVHVNWNYRSLYRRGLLTGRSIAENTYQWGSKRLNLDVTCEYYLTKQLGFFATFRNITAEPIDNQAYNPSTPEVARFFYRGDYASIWSFGVKGTF